MQCLFTDSAPPHHVHHRLSTTLHTHHPITILSTRTVPMPTAAALLHTAPRPAPPPHPAGIAWPQTVDPGVYVLGTF